MGEGNRENTNVSQVIWVTELTENIASREVEKNQDEILGDISNVMGRTSTLEEGDREIDNVSWDRSLVEEKIFMGKGLLLKRTSCSV